MNRFYFEGRAADAPELSETGSGVKIARLRLIQNEYAGQEEGGERRERITTIQFTAFNKTAEILARNVLKGDQLFVAARIRNNNYEAEGRAIYGFNFEVDEFTFGAPGAAKREKLAER